METLPKVGLVGGGNIGGTVAYLMALKNIAEIVILDHHGSMAQGKALDIAQSMPIEGSDVSLTGTDDYSELVDCEVVIVTAGMPRRPGMSRDDLLLINKEIITQVAGQLSIHCPDAFFIILTNPLDAMVMLFQSTGAFPTHKVVGMAGLLDAARFRLFLSDELKVSAEDIYAFVLGGHGDTMVPIPRYTTVGGVSLSELITMGWLRTDRLEHIIERTRNGGAEIVGLLQRDSAFYAPATAAVEMACSYLHDRKRLFSCASYLDGQYGVRGLYIGVPTIIGAGGAERIMEVPLTDDERKLFDRSVASVKSLIYN